MNNFNPDKKYEAFKIPDRSEYTEERSMSFSGQMQPGNSRSKYGQLQRAQANQEDVFYEIEYDSCPMPGVGRFVLKSQKVEQPKQDEIRNLFYRMRDIAHDYRPVFYASSKFYDIRVQKEASKVFYKQGIFMKDFTDAYDKVVIYASYYPNYQMMGYEQLRTYFTWRTQVRQGEIQAIFLSYAYLYIYELICNIGVDDAQSGLERLLFFWREYREFDAALDKYVLKWLKDYYIYYDMPGSFPEFLERYELTEFYPSYSLDKNSNENSFERYCDISKYDIRKSKFYTEDRVVLITECFEQVFERLKLLLAEQGISLEEIIFQPTKGMTAWLPFQGALFYDWKNQRNRKVVLSEKEVYICNDNHWTCSSMITTDAGKRLIGYVMKQMEVVLRRLTKYKFKLSADSSMVSSEVLKVLVEKGISLERVITEAVTAYYRETTKTVVKVDSGMLARIREEAFMTQEKLTVPEEDTWSFALGQAEKDEKCAEVQPPESSMKVVRQEHFEKAVDEYQQQTPDGLLLGDKLLSGLAGPWQELHSALTETELQALAILCTDSGDIRQFADEHSMMLEVLMDGINEKAMDTVGDSLTDDELVIYEDYIEEVRKMVEGL